VYLATRSNCQSYMFGSDRKAARASRDNYTVCPFSCLARKRLMAQHGLGGDCSKSAGHVWAKLLSLTRSPSFAGQVVNNNCGLWSLIARDEVGSLVVQSILENWEDGQKVQSNAIGSSSPCKTRPLMAPGVIIRNRSLRRLSRTRSTAALLRGATL
jgi:hypothetical protein